MNSSRNIVAHIRRRTANERALSATVFLRFVAENMVNCHKLDDL